MNDMDKWFGQMVNRGLASTSNSWIQGAVEQKHPNLTLDLAYSMMLTYSGLDKILLQRQKLN